MRGHNAVGKLTFSPFPSADAILTLAARGASSLPPQAENARRNRIGLVANEKICNSCIRGGRAVMRNGRPAASGRLVRR